MIEEVFPKMRVSIITVGFNAAQTIEDCINSVSSQSYPDKEHIIIDGGSNDGTQEIIKKHRDKISYWVSEPDKGIYDAMNKGILQATGDVIGVLNSDDFYAHPRVLEGIVYTMIHQNVDTCYGDLVYVDKKKTHKVTRYWKAGTYRRNRFLRGWMPPHPTFFAKAKLYHKYGFFNLDFPLAADYELMLRFLYRYSASAAYVPEVLVHMRTGGTSQPMSYTAKAILENYRSWKVNDLKVNPLTFILKPSSKLLQFLNRRCIDFHKDKFL